MVLHHPYHPFRGSALERARMVDAGGLLVGTGRVDNESGEREATITMEKLNNAVYFTINYNPYN